MATPTSSPEPPSARRAACACGQLTLTVRGEPLRIAVCHCLECQRRTGSAFGVQARFARERVRACALTDARRPSPAAATAVAA